MPGPHHAPKGGYVKPKNMKKTMGRLLGYLTKSKLPLLFVLLCLLVSVGANLGGTALQRPLINMLIDPGLTPEHKLSQLAVRIAMLAGVYILGCLATTLAYLRKSAVIVCILPSGFCSWVCLV